MALVWSPWSVIAMSPATSHSKLVGSGVGAIGGGHRGLPGAALVSVPVMAPVLVFRLKPEGRPVTEYVTVVPLMLSVAAAERLTVSPTLLVGPVGGLVNAIAAIDVPVEGGFAVVGAVAHGDGDGVRAIGRCSRRNGPGDRAGGGIDDQTRGQALRGVILGRAADAVGGTDRERHGVAFVIGLVGGRGDRDGAIDGPVQSLRCEIRTVLGHDGDGIGAKLGACRWPGFP